MKKELLLQFTIPHSTTRGKSTRKLLTNYILNLHYGTYSQIHQQWKAIVIPEVTALNTKNPFGHTNETVYQVALGFYRGKSTKNVDIDGFSILGKWVIDALVEVTAIPSDSIVHINEFKCKYLGHSEDGLECVVAQLTREVPDVLPRQD